MLLVKDFKISVQRESNEWIARAWNAHCEFFISAETRPEAIDGAVRGCLEYHVARMLESVYIRRIGTAEIVYENLPCRELRKKTVPRDWVVLGNSAAVEVDGQYGLLEMECENCHGFQVIRVVSIRFLSTVPPGK
jgi:hypothetical protein